MFFLKEKVRVSCKASRFLHTAALELALCLQLGEGKRLPFLLLSTRETQTSSDLFVIMSQYSECPFTEIQYLESSADTEMLNWHPSSLQSPMSIL